TNNISGPLSRVQILGCTSPTNCPNPDANSLPLGSNTIAVSVDLTGALRNATDKNDLTAQCVFANGTVHQFACLKVTVTNSGSGSTQSVDCDPFSKTNNTLEDQLANGCVPEYAINDGTSAAWNPCPNKTLLDDPLNNQSGDGNHFQPWQCTALFTGN